MFQYSKQSLFGKRKGTSIITGAKGKGAMRVKRSSKGNINRKPTRIALVKNVESHFVDTGNQTPECSTTGIISLLNTIPQGTTVNQRVGKKCLLQSVWIQGFFQPQATAVYNNLSALLILDRQSNGAAIPAITDILVSTNTNDFQNDAKRSRYKILRRWDCVIAGSTAAAPTGACGELPTANINAYVPLNFVMEFNTSATTGVQATIEKGALYMVTVGTAATGTTSGTFNYFCRVRFTEDF